MIPTAVLVMLCCAAPVGLPDPGTVGSHQAYAARVQSSRDASLRSALAVYDAHLERRPRDVVAAVERCKLISALMGDDEEDAKLDEAYSQCTEQLQAHFPRDTVALLFRLETTWGDEAIELADRLLAGEAAAWSGAARARVHKRLAEMKAAADEVDAAGDHAERAMALDATLDLTQLVAAKRINEKKPTEAVAVLLSRSGDGEPWQRVDKARMLVEVEAFAEAVRLLEDIRASSPPGYRGDPVLYAAALEGAGRTDDAREAYAHVEGEWNKKRALQRLFTLDVAGSDPEAALRSYRALRDLGWSADPLGRHRLALIRRFPSSPWQARELLGVLALVACLALLALAPLLWVMPVHYLWLWREQRRREAASRAAAPASMDGRVAAHATPTDSPSQLAAPAATTGTPPALTTLAATTAECIAPSPRDLAATDGEVPTPPLEVRTEPPPPSPGDSASNDPPAPKGIAPASPTWGFGALWLVSAIVLVGQSLALYVFAYGDLQKLLEPTLGLPSADAAALAAAALASICAAALALPLLLRRDTWAVVLGPGRWTVEESLKAGGRTYAVVIGIGIVYQLLARASGLAVGAAGSVTGGELSTRAMIAAIGHTHGFAVMMLAVAVIVPVAEEFVFRGVVLGAYSRWVSFGWANVLQASLFTLGHDAPAAMPVLFALGLLAGRLRQQSGGLLASILLHGVNNVVAVLVMWKAGRL